MLNVRNCSGMVVLGTMLALPAMAQTQAQPAPARAAVDPAATPAAPQSDEALARQLSNPVASLVSVPFQFNWDQPVGPDDETRFVLNVQPVIPLSLNDDWNLILRWIMPYIGQPALFEGGVPTQGMGDIVASMFFSPAKPGRFIWGAGPVFMLPTNASPVLGTSKWSVGPSFVILKQSGQWTFGMLANHLWSFAGNDVSGGVERGQDQRLVPAAVRVLHDEEQRHDGRVRGGLGQLRAALRPGAGREPGAGGRHAVDRPDHVHRVQAHPVRPVSDEHRRRRGVVRLSARRAGVVAAAHRQHHPAAAPVKERVITGRRGRPAAPPRRAARSGG